jgi:hypothetical protein
MLERVSEARVTRQGLPAGLMTRLKDSIKTWSGQLAEGISQSILGPPGSMYVSLFGFIPF